jgi:hypothetical protein
MPVELSPPQVERRRRRRESYPSFFAALIDRCGEWASLPLDEVAGKTDEAKQSIIWSLARIRGLRVQTTVQDGRIFARVIESKTKETTNAD